MILRSRTRCLSLALITGVVVLAASAAHAQAPMSATKGLKYWLAQDIVQVDVTVTTTKTTDYEATQEKGGKGEIVLKTSTKVARDGALASRTIADRLAPTYAIDVLSGKMSDNSVSVTVGSSGLLESVSAASTGRGAQILTSIAKFAGSLLSIATLGPFGPLKIPAADVNVMSRSLPADRDFFGNVVGPKGPKSVPDTCDPFAPPFTTLPIRVRAFAAQSEPGCLLFWQIRRQDTLLADLRSQRAALEAKLDLTTDADLPKLREKIKDRTTAIAAEEKIQADYQGRFNALLEAFVADKGLGTTTSVQKFAVVLGLDEIPADISNLPNCANAYAFFKSTRVVVLARSDAGTMAAKPVGADGKPTCTQAPPKPAATTVNATGQSADGKMMRIMFRQPASWVIEARATTCKADDTACLDKPPVTDTTSLQSLTPVDLVRVGTEPSYVEFEAKAFSDGKVAMTFERGHPTRLERSGTASMASIATGLADATRSAQTSYAEGLASIVEIQKSRRAIETNDLTAQIEEAKKQKELLDAKLAATGASNSFDMLLQQNELNQKLSLLQAQSALKAAEDASDQKLEIEGLKRELEKLKAQIDVLNAQRQYDELQRKK